MPGAGVPARLVLLGTGTQCEMTAAAAAAATADLTDQPTGSLSLSLLISVRGNSVKVVFLCGSD